MTNSKDSLDEILDKFGLCKCGRAKTSKNFAYHVCVEKGLKQAIRQWVSDEVIGADEHIDPPISSIEGSKQRAFGRNMLRAKQRAKLLKGDIDESR